MKAIRVAPILNVSDIQESFAWFEKLGWKKGWDWGTPPRFGGVYSGECEIFLCKEGQGSRGKSDHKMTFGPEGNEAADKGVWMTIWVVDVDEIHNRCIEEGLEITWPPTDMPWNVREMHVGIWMVTSSELLQSLKMSSQLVAPSRRSMRALRGTNR